MAQPWNDEIERLLDISPAGANSAQLNAALRELLLAWNAEPQSDADLDTAVSEVASALNWDIDDARQAFARFREKATDESKNDFTDSFLASNEHLLFGKLVGDALDINPIFASLLSPTGGMVGPGGVSFHVKGGVLGYHGIAHDAGGYLCRKHGVDPGYEYIVDRTGKPCENNPLAGQVTGIAFWFRILKLGWANFLAFADPTSLLSTPEADLSSLLDPGRISIAGTSPPAAATKDGVLLNRAEVRFLQSLILRESDPADAALIAEGLESLLDRDLISGSEIDGYVVNDQLVLATAVSLEPELMLEASLSSLDEASQSLRYYKFGEYLVEQTNPSSEEIRLAGLRDAGHATQRLGQVIPLAATDLDTLSLSLTEDEFDTAVAAAETGDLDLGVPLGLDSDEARAAPPTASNDLNNALGSGKIIGAIRVQQFDDLGVASTRDLQFYQGSRATWLVSRDSEEAGQVNVALASSATFDQQLGLTSE